MELINVKIFEWNDRGNGGKVKIQLSSNSDLYFYYVHYA